MSRSDQTIKARLRFYGDLNDWLTIKSKDKTIERILSAPTSVKDLIEGCGVPHTEVDLILVDGNPVDFSYLPRSEDPVVQRKEVIIRFKLKYKTKPFTRCPNCNGVLESVPKSEILEQLEPLTRKYHKKFSRCVDCSQIYWAGSHLKRLNPKVRYLIGKEKREVPE